MRSVDGVDYGKLLRVVFLIRSLESGGAERQLVELARSLDPQQFAVTVVTYYAGGILADELRATRSVRVVCAGKRGRWDIVGFVWRLWGLIRAAQPHVVHGYMYGANELALLLGRAAHARVIWGVRASNVDLRYYDWATRLLIRTGAWLSSYVDVVVANSEAGRRFHIGLGYPARRFVVIPNGIDTERYRLDQSKRQQVRAQWSVSDDEILIGLVARIDPMKDHETFLRAAAVLLATRMGVRFIMVGHGSQENVAALKGTAERLGIGHAVIWAGRQDDMTAIYNATDLITSSSAFGEGFSNSLAEAMSCERVCVATDVGDARAVIGDTGEVVSPKSPDALAMAWCRLLELRSEERAEYGRRARARIVENFSVSALAARSGDVLLRGNASTHSITSPF